MTLMPLSLVVNWQDFTILLFITGIILNDVRNREIASHFTSRCHTIFSGSIRENFPATLILIFSTIFVLSNFHEIL